MLALALSVAGCSGGGTASPAPKATAAPTPAGVAKASPAAAAASPTAPPSSAAPPSPAPAASPSPAAVPAPVAPPSPAAAPSAGAAPASAQIATLDLRFEPNAVSVKAGSVSFTVPNQGAIEHNFVVEDQSRRELAKIANIEVGKTEQLTVTLPAGAYTMVCTLPGHREAGMVGTITATP